MGRIYYDQSIKDEAIRRYINGESSGKIAKDMGINSPDLIRKWVQVWRKKHNLPNDGYRESSIANNVDEIQRLRNIIMKIKEERNLVLKLLRLVIAGEIIGWEELLSRLRSPE